MRTVPPKQIAAFISEFDSILHSAFETLLESDISAKVLDIAKLPPEYGGRGWKTGLHTFGAHYLTSIAKNATPIDNIVPAWDIASVARQDVGKWLALHAGTGHDPADMVVKIRKTGAVTGLLSEDGRADCRSHSGTIERGGTK